MDAECVVNILSWPASLSQGFAHVQGVLNRLVDIRRNDLNEINDVDEFDDYERLIEKYEVDCVDDETTELEFCKDLVNDALNAVRACLGSREVCVHMVGDNVALITGGMTWGDDPTDMLEPFYIVLTAFGSLYKETDVGELSHGNKDQGSETDKLLST